MRDIDDPGTGAPPNLFRLAGDKDICDKQQQISDIFHFLLCNPYDIQRRLDM